MKQTKHQTVNSLFIEAALVSMQIVTLTTTRQLTSLELKKVHIIVDGTVLPTKINEQTDKRVTLFLLEPYLFGFLCLAGIPGQLCPIKIKDVVRTKEFDSTFTYKGSDLGVQYTSSKSSFAVWTPTAIHVHVIIYKNWHDEVGRRFPLIRDSCGVWRIQLDGDWKGYWYHYEVYNPGMECACIVDPYATFLSINGLKAMIGKLDQNKNEKVGLRSLAKEKTIIYEMHIRDFTSAPSSGVKKKGKFLGLVETGTTNDEGLSSGLDYISKLGITHVQLMPVQEFSTVDESNQQATYNWGYDTNHFFSLEGSYSENPYSGYSRVKELRETVDDFHKKGIRVILDVIYNHVFIWEKSALELLVPGYYFRYASNGEISNGTGVGNDMATERSMARKLIIDSVTYLMTEFDLDGLRFDLMGIIDLETMKQISETVVKFKNDFLLLGEGWRLHTAYPQDRLATLDQATQLPTVAFFDDQFRDLLKGSIFSTHSGGFGQTKSNPLALRDAISGGPSQFVLPTQAIHYVEVHDNQTLWDRLVQLHPTEKNDVLESRHALATSMILLSQGIPFIHAGQEWCRTKYGQENSYSDPDWVNQLNWNRRTTYDHYNRFVTGLIKLRQAYPVFSMATFADISKKIKWFICDSDFLMYQLTSKCKNNAYSQKIIVVHNGTSEKRLLNCKVSGIWQVCVDGKAASLVPLYSLRGEELIVSPLSTMVCMQ